MLRLQDGHAIYNNTEDLGPYETLKNTGEGFAITLPDGSLIFIPEADSTPDEREVFAAYHEYYKDTGGIPPVEEPPTDGIPAPTPEEQIAEMKALIADQNQTISDLMDILFTTVPELQSM